MSTGQKTNVTTSVTSNAGKGNSAIALLNVTVPALPPTLSKIFAPNRVASGGTTTLTFSVANPNAAALTGIGFNDVLPGGLRVAHPNGLTGACGGGTITAAAGSQTIALTNATLAGTASCTFSLNVVAPPDTGSLTNVTTSVSSSAGSGPPASANLIVASPPVLSKAFAAASIGLGGTTALTFTLRNPNSNVPLSGLAFTDTLPSGLTVATPNGLTGSCVGNTTAAGNSIALANGILAAGASCTIMVRVTGTALGVQNNVTSAVTANETLPGAAANATIHIGNPLQISYFPNLHFGDGVINVSNGGTMGTDNAISGTICINVYAFSPDEVMLACCACPVTPNGLSSLSARNDLIRNTMTPAVPTSIVVKLLASMPNAGSCNAATVTTPQLANGMLAWGTKLHEGPNEAFSPTHITEAPFTPVPLSDGELTRVTQLCSFMQANGSGYGICSTCRPGAQGAARQ